LSSLRSWCGFPLTLSFCLPPLFPPPSFFCGRNPPPVHRAHRVPQFPFSPGLFFFLLIFFGLPFAFLFFFCAPRPFSFPVSQSLLPPLSSCKALPPPPLCFPFCGLAPLHKRPYLPLSFVPLSAVPFHCRRPPPLEFIAFFYVTLRVSSSTVPRAGSPWPSLFSIRHGSTLSCHLHSPFFVFPHERAPPFSTNCFCFFLW